MATVLLDYSTYSKKVNDYLINVQKFDNLGKIFKYDL